MAHDVADQDAEAVFIHLGDFEEIPCESGNGDVAGAEGEVAVLAGSDGGESLVGERLLDFAG